MAARSIWNGTISIGEVVVPVKLFGALTPQGVHFHEVRLSDGCRIEHHRVGSESGREIPAKRLAKAYETSRGHQVVLTEDEIAAARGSRPKVIEIEHCAADAEIDPVYYERPYIIGAQPEGERAYRVLLAALEKTKLVGIGRFVLRTREQLVAVRPRGKALMLYTMRFADEVLDRSDMKVPPLRREPSPKEAAMARHLIEALAEQWRPAQHTDRHREAVLAVLERKAKGEQIDLEKQPAPQASPDLMAALQESVERAPSRRSPKRSSSARDAGRSKAKPKAGSRGKAKKTAKAKAKTKAKAKAKTRGRS